VILPARRRSAELMDGMEVDGAELARSLADLERVNRWLGGARVVLESLGPLLRTMNGKEIRVLDVATGGADIPLRLVRWAREEGIALRVVATDAHPRTVEIARERAAHEPAVTLEEADGLALPYADGAFDYAMCNTALHHFDPPDAIRLLAELRRVAARGVVVTDLVRSWTGLAAVHALSATAWRTHRITRHDSVASVRGAYTVPEMRALARRAGLGEHRARSWFLFARAALVARVGER
jgi:SAM-dependent methyltransferase